MNNRSPRPATVTTVCLTRFADLSLSPYMIAKDIDQLNRLASTHHRTCERLCSENMSLEVQKKVESHQDRVEASIKSIAFNTFKLLALFEYDPRGSTVRLHTPNDLNSPLYYL